MQKNSVANLTHTVQEIWIVLAQTKLTIVQNIYVVKHLYRISRKSGKEFSRC